MASLVSKETLSAKPEKFDGINFRRWQNQMRFWLTTLGLISAISESTTETLGSDSSQNITRRVQTRASRVRSESEPSSSSTIPPEEIDYHCLHRILGGLSDNLYDLYYNSKSASELWDILDAKYGLDDTGIKRFKASDFNKFKFVDNKPMNEQIHEFESLVHELKALGSQLDESFQVACLLDKLPPSWSDFTRTLSHTQGSLTLTQLFGAIRIEEQHRLREVTTQSYQPKANMVENKSFKSHKKHFPFKHNNFKKNNRPFHKSKPQDPNPHQEKPNENDEERACYVCGRTNHLAFQCYHRKKSARKAKRYGPPSGPQVNMVTDGGGASEPSFRTQVQEL